MRRFICNILVGLPLLGLLGGSLFFLAQTIFRFSQGPQQWEQCRTFLTWLLNKWSVLERMTSFVTVYCDFSIGAHVALASLILGCVTIPLGLILARGLK